MSRICEVTGKGGLVGHMISHSQRKTLVRKEANLHTKRFFIPEENRWIKLKVSAAGLRTINKNGIQAIAKQLGV
jgi:large subunit ribosomal protein L28